MVVIHTLWTFANVDLDDVEVVHILWLDSIEVSFQCETN
jgi:hypothetical protein